VLLAIGLCMRALLFDTTPILEIDFYRYLWDGAVVAGGHNPYLVSPLQAGESSLAELARQSGPVIERINYAELRTIYPPLTQLFFALSHWLDSWSLNAWRSILLLADAGGLLLILGTLKTLRKPLHWSLVYWWNPLLLQQTYNALHMDVLLVAPLVAALWLLVAQRHRLAAIMLALGAGIKLWPLLLLPFALRPLLRQPRRLLQACLAITGILALAVLPLLYFGLGEHSGLGSFAQHWQRNSAIYPLLETIVSLISEDPAGLARVLIAAVLIAVVAWLNRSAASSPEVIVRNLLWVTALLFLLSPAQFPWYAIWFLPLLCFHPSPPLLLLTALMPVYYLKFWFLARGAPQAFDQGLVWIQYLPVLLWLAVEQFSRLRAGALRLRHV
jgi:alpha-1,6-mannosyltransferase